jgi:N4-(beta-N-acetylglucosaminyl)-L-asparaginase
LNISDLSDIFRFRSPDTHTLQRRFFSRFAEGLVNNGFQQLAGGFMSSSLTRRRFLFKSGSLSMSLPLLGGLAESLFAKQTSGHRAPVLLCSRALKGAGKILSPGWDILVETDQVLDAIEKSANISELDPEDTTVGYGGNPNEDGIVQLDASVMYGPTHNCGSVAALEGIKTPSSVARLVMERTDHIHLVGKGAQKFALMHGFKIENLLTEAARKNWLQWKENLSEEDDWLPPQGENENDDENERTTGTINILGINSKGDIAGMTTTSGLSWKIPGRIGDSPIIGAGLYVDNEVGAAGATGRGEEVIRSCGSFYVIEKMRNGMTPQKACEAICQRIIDINGGPEKINFSDKFVAINKSGEIGCAAIRERKGDEPKASYIDKDGLKEYTGTLLLEIPENN